MDVSSHNPPPCARFLLRYFLLLLLLFVVEIPSSAYGQVTFAGEDSLQIGQMAPTFSLFELGKTDRIYLSHHTGDLPPEAIAQGFGPSVVILSFFSSTCVPCEKEMPELTRICRRYADRDLKLLFIATQDTLESTVLSWLAARPGIQGTVLFDLYGVVAKLYQVTTLPRMFIIDRGRIILHIERGYQPVGYEQRITQILDHLLGPPGNP
jgi:thiol-disulfide isomerase/thioredoxin